MTRHIKHFLLIYYSIFFRTQRFKRYFSGNEKSRIRILTELFVWSVKEHELFNMFYAFGLNLRSRKFSDYIGKREFRRIKQKAERLLIGAAYKEGVDYSILTRDKFYATSILKANNINCIDNLLFISHGIGIDSGGDEVTLKDLLGTYNKMILKNSTLEASNGLYILEHLDTEVYLNKNKISYSQLCSLVSDGSWVLQKRISPGTEISRINKTALNITRIVTVNSGRKIRYITGFQSFATGNNDSDGWDKGTIYVGIDIDNSTLRSDGFYHPMIGTESIVTVHPDSGASFASRIFGPASHRATSHPIQ